MLGQFIAKQLMSGVFIPRHFTAVPCSSPRSFCEASKVGYEQGIGINCPGMNSPAMNCPSADITV